MLLLLKLIVAPGLVAAVTLAVRRGGRRSADGCRDSRPSPVGHYGVYTRAAGSAATVTFVNGFVRSILGFGAFCFALALTVDRLGLGAGLACALAAQFAVSGAILAYTTGPYQLMRYHQRRPFDGGSGRDNPGSPPRPARRGGSGAASVESRRTYQ